MRPAWYSAKAWRITSARLIVVPQPAGLARDAPFHLIEGHASDGEPMAHAGHVAEPVVGIQGAPLLDAEDLPVPQAPTWQHPGCDVAHPVSMRQDSRTGNRPGSAPSRSPPP